LVILEGGGNGPGIPTPEWRRTEPVFGGRISAGRLL
jgi:hypothetical protein